MTKLEVKEAVKLAKTYIADLYDGEDISNIGLEEVDYDDREWRITIGFFRPWEKPGNIVFSTPERIADFHRTYKVVHIDDDSGRVITVKNFS